ncbi:energy transducer TonB [Hymenobacter sp. BT186]|uniref:Energy transducer TonB n=1 Tax=Hymenobacter telluris TaxID=2816474 RepID=A0A939JEK1_9BACT|nr:energy transducer TonB [Hymenobacter telluris]MBO0360043.1 energy transducer TonB [Hymenobacter telluris]MBW3376070.1 energy transducer TonB [Hymenobacter norwichensis]
MKHLFFMLLLVACGRLAQAQQPTPAKQPTELKAGRMQAQARPAANRPDVAPQFSGGAAALGAFFQENIKYSEAPGVSSPTGNVVVTATIEADGRLTNPVVAQSLSAAQDAEALRVLALLPPWKPATRKGQPVPVQISLPVPFGNAQILKVEQGKTKYQ